MAHTTRYGNTYTDQEWQEVQEMYRQEGEAASRYFEMKDELIKKAAGFLHREFEDVPVSTFVKALNTQFEVDPKQINFTSEQKKARFDAAVNWIDSELNKI